jgi:hypothetical protein
MKHRKVMQFGSRMVMVVPLLAGVLVACNPPAPPPPPPTLSVSPTTASLDLALGQQSLILRATATNSTAVINWSVVGGGSLSANTGAEVSYIAPPTGSNQIQATVTATLAGTSPALTASSQITVKFAPPLSPTISVSPASATLDLAQNQKTLALQATVTNSNAAINWTLVGSGSLSATTGTDISYTAPASGSGQAQATVTATLAGLSPTVSANSQITVKFAPLPIAILKRASKSSAIAISGDDKYVVQVNPENDSITVFRSVTDEKLSELIVGDEPSAVVIAPDDNTAYVTLRGSGQLVKIANIRTANPSVVATVEVGSEPTGLALSPCGDKIYVAEWGESRVSVFNSENLRFTLAKIITNPRAIAVSNDNDEDCTDEKVVVTEFYGRTSGNEASDSSRTGAVRILSGQDLTDSSDAVLFPALSPGAFVPVSTGPNQLASVAIVGDKFYVTAIAASPDGLPKFNENVFPLILVGNLSGRRLGVISLADEIKKLSVTPKNFMADLIDISFVGSTVAYLTGKGADAVQRVLFNSDTSVSLGQTIPAVPQIDLLGNNIGCNNPIGIATPHDTAILNKLYVNCWVSRTTTVVNLAEQKAVLKLAAASAPQAGLETTINKGRRFYFTARGRWSNEAWSSCGSCHPDGLSDNITWRFAAGPRQSTSMDGTYSHTPRKIQKQRILNWTGIFDEMHDFERNTRDVSGGIGALVKSLELLETSRLSLLKVLPLVGGAIGGLEKPLRELQEGITGPTATVDAGPSLLKDWDEIDEFVKTIRPVQGRKILDSGAISRGRQLFAAGKCQNCHGGEGWTASKRFWTPGDKTNIDLTAAIFGGAAIGSPHTKQIAAEPNAADATKPIAPAQVACVLRKVGTFGIPGDVTASIALELKAGNPPVAKAQGEFAGYNVPSLYGLQVGAPFLHHGQAKSLSDLLSDTRWNAHRLSGNPTFNNGNPLTGQNLTDMISFLWSIDANAPEFDDVQDVCPKS